MKTIFRSKIDARLGAVLLASAAISLAGGALVLVQRAPGDAWLAIFFASMGAVLPVWVFVDTRYVIGEGMLLIRSGPFRWRIPLNQIRQIVPARNALSSPALSLDRLRIEYDAGRSRMVSPLDQQGFLAAIRAKTENTA